MAESRLCRVLERSGVIAPKNCELCYIDHTHIETIQPFGQVVQFIQVDQRFDLAILVEGAANAQGLQLLQHLVVFLPVDGELESSK